MCVHLYYSFNTGALTCLLYYLLMPNSYLSFNLVSVIFFHRMVRLRLNRNCTTTSPSTSPNLTSSHLLEMWVSFSTAFHISRPDSPEFYVSTHSTYFFIIHFYFHLFMKCSCRGGNNSFDVIITDTVIDYYIWVQSVLITPEKPNI